ncbi:hypothetical protein [Faecalimicrobium sp. JNUCC 81]
MFKNILLPSLMDPSIVIVVPLEVYFFDLFLSIFKSSYLSKSILILFN